MPRHLRGSPSAHQPKGATSPRDKSYHPHIRLSNITIERGCSEPHPMTKHHVDFLLDFTQRTPLTDVIGGKGKVVAGGVKGFGSRKLPKD